MSYLWVSVFELEALKWLGQQGKVVTTRDQDQRVQLKKVSQKKCILKKIYNNCLSDIEKSCLFWKFKYLEVSKRPETISIGFGILQTLINSLVCSKGIFFEYFIDFKRWRPQMKPAKGQILTFRVRSVRQKCYTYPQARTGELYNILKDEPFLITCFWLLHELF